MASQVFHTHQQVGSIPTSATISSNMSENLIEEWSLKITRVHNGFILRYPGGQIEVVQTEFSEYPGDDPTDLSRIEELLWTIIDHFDLGGTKYSRERIRIIREPGEKYEHIKADEDIVEKTYWVIEKKNVGREEALSGKENS